MSKLIRRTAGTRKGAALIVALQLTALTFLSLISFIGGPQSRDGGTPADTQVSAPQVQTQTQADQAQTETDPIQQSFDPWDVVADENGDFDTSWYIYSPDFLGATFLATATGQTSQLT